MKLAVFSESAADEAAIRILVDGLLGQTTEPVKLPQLRTRGWPSVIKVLPAVMKSLHYQTDADVLVLVVDSDLSDVHLREHDAADPAPKCRFCQLRRTVAQTQNHLRPRQGRNSFRVGIGLAVPSIEAWLRCGVDPRVTAAVWMQSLQARKFPFDTRRLKTALYGAQHFSFEHQTKRMTEEAHRLSADLVNLEKWFPNGFGALAQAVRTWSPKT